MQSRTARLGLLAAIIVLAIVLFVVLKDDSSDSSGDAATGVQVINVKSGKPVGGVKTLTYDKGDQVQLEFRLDQPEEEIHVHGYEIAKPAERSPVRFTFPAKLDGVFEVEVHGLDGSEAPAAELHINP